MATIGAPLWILGLEAPNTVPDPTPQPPFFPPVEEAELVGLDLPTLFSTVGISIVASTTVLTGQEAAVINDQLVFQLDGYDQELAANGGYISCNIRLNSNLNDLSDWFLSGLGRDIEVFNHSGETIWNGFVNEVTISVGGYTDSRGQILDIANRAKVKYQRVTYDTNPPVGGGSAETEWGDNLGSQNNYGILHEVLSAGEGLETNMEKHRDLFLSERAWPDLDQEINTDSQSAPQVTISCRGYGDLLTRQIYNNRDGVDAVEAQDKIAAVLNANSNGLFSNQRLSENTTTAVKEFEDNDSTADSVIRDVVNLGDEDGNRWLFGVYENRLCIYEPVDYNITYQHSLSDQVQRILTYEGGVWVLPWNVKPGKFMLKADFLVGTEFLSTEERDPRLVFIESVRYTAPWTLSIKGGKANRGIQLLNRMGLGGI